MYRSILVRIPAFAAYIVVLPTLVPAQFDGQGAPHPEGQENVLLRGGLEIRAGAQGLHTYGRNSGAGHMEFALRGPGNLSDRKGSLSIGIAATFHPRVGSWNDLPIDIGHVREFNLVTTNDVEASLTLGGTELRPNELFLSSGIDLDRINIGGNISFSVGSRDILVLDLYRMRDVRMDMWGIMLPVRWHFGEDKIKGARFFAEAGVGVDVLRTQATYDLTRTTLRMNVEPQIISFSLTTDDLQDVAPMNGELSSNVLFTRGMLGGGVDLGRFRVFMRIQRTLSAPLRIGEEEYRRVRGNVLSLPVIAEAWNDKEVSSTLADGGIVPYGRTDISRNGDGTSLAQSSDKAHGVDRFWDRTQALLGVAFLLR